MEIHVKDAKVYDTTVIKQSGGGGSVIGYCMTSRAEQLVSGPKPEINELEWKVVRTEADMITFHNHLVQDLVKQSKGTKSAEDIEKSLDFPIRPYQTGLELIPLLAFGGSLFVCRVAYHYDEVTSFLYSLVICSLSFVVVLAIGFAKFPLTWSAPKRIGPLNAYLSKVLAIEGVSKLPATLALFQEPMRPDWPGQMGDIDLLTQDLPHASAKTEWWYYNAHVSATNPSTGEKRDLSLFVTFFRVISGKDLLGNTTHSHAAVWALIDPSNTVAHRRYVHQVLLEKSAPKDFLKSVEEEISLRGASFYRTALKEVLEKSNLPLPDRMFTKDPKVSISSLNFDYDCATLVKDNFGRYVIKASANNDTFIDLTFDPLKAPVRHGDNGVVAGYAGDEMFYYCIPRMSVSGEITLIHGSDKKNPLVLQVSGEGWYDHEFGGMYHTPSKEEEKAKERTNYAWNWVSAQLDDGSEVSAAMLANADTYNVEKKTGVIEIKAIVIKKDGTRDQYDGMVDGTSFEPVAGTYWNSTRTYKSYPTQYKLLIPSIGMDLDVQAVFADQEVLTLLGRPGFWEGRCNISGKIGDRQVKGLAFVERNGFEPTITIGKFFKGVNEEVLHSVATMYPLNPTQDEAVALCATPETSHYMDDVPLDILGKTLIEPVRTIADRGGKSWRSYAALATIDVVGGDSREFVQWIAMPEFLHVGSLLIDDIQDESKTRRGGPCAHLIHGIPITINAGTGAYFMAECLLSAPNMNAETKLKCYQLYMSALRGGHAGQALDIYGNDYLMDQVVRDGNADLLEKRILAIHRLKTAVPAGTLARLGSTVGGGTDEQIDAVGRYFEGVGLAFQIQDDVLNLRGIYSKGSDKMAKGTILKTLGEDITDGKVTMPVCKYMKLQKDPAQRVKLWDTIKSKPKEREIVDGVIAELERVGAIDACVEQANKLVEDAWAKLDPIIPDSFPKLMLRVFGHFVNDQAGG